MRKRKASEPVAGRAIKSAGKLAPPDGALHLYSDRDFWEARYRRESEETATLGDCGGGDPQEPP